VSEKLTIVCLLAALLTLSVRRPQAIACTVQLSPEQVQKSWLSRLDGQHFSATVDLTVDRQSGREKRRLTVWRDDLGPHRERVLARFDEPPDMRGLSLLYLENPDRPNDFFLYRPAVRRVRRVPETFVTEAVYGIDLEYVGIRLARTRAESVTVDSTSGHPTLRLVEHALESNRFDRRVTWFDPENFIPVRTIHYRGESEVLRGRTEEVRIVQGIPTAMRIVFEKMAARETVTVEVTTIDYITPIPGAFFSTMALVKEGR
jgi:Outer membrane lipoprotein-sorting protein